MRRWRRPILTCLISTGTTISETVTGNILLIQTQRSQLHKTSSCRWVIPTASNGLPHSNKRRVWGLTWLSGKACKRWRISNNFSSYVTPRPGKSFASQTTKNKSKSSTAFSCTPSMKSLLSCAQSSRTSLSMRVFLELEAMELGLKLSWWSSKA